MMSGAVVSILLVIASLPWLFELIFFRKKLLIKLWWISLPLSFSLLLGSSRISFPSEMLMLFWLCVPLMKREFRPDLQLLRHPISILLILELALFALSTITSSMPSVSVKRTVIHAAFIMSGFFFLSPHFRYSENIQKLFVYLTIGLVPVLLKHLLFLGAFNFNSNVAPAAPRPFFADHTEFGAFAALLLPVLFCSWRYLRKTQIKPKLLIPFLLIICFIAVLFSFSRAVWISTLASATLYLLILSGMRFRHLMAIVAILGVLGFQYGDNIYLTIRENEAESDRDEVLEQLKSVANVKTDVSNLERINRWKSAWKMFQERPLLGFGPGTYQFQYSPYQELKDKTVISTNFGTAGNAHSEYLMYLSETGIFGFLLFLFQCIYLLFLSFRIIHHTTDPHTRYIGIGLLLAIGGYLVHALVNSFLETDKIGLVFYFAMAGVVGMSMGKRN